MLSHYLFLYILFQQKAVKELKKHNLYSIHIKKEKTEKYSLDEIIGGTL